MRILIVAPVSSSAMHVGGGVAVTYKVLAEKLRARGHTVTVLSSWNNTLEYAYVRIHPTFRMIKVSMKNLNVIRQHILQSDVIVCPDSSMVACIGLECWRYGIPSIWIIHTNFLAVAKIMLHRYLYYPIDLATIFFLRTYGETFNHILTTSHDYMSSLEERGFRISGYIDQGFKADVFKKYDTPEVVSAMRKKLTGGNENLKIMLYAGRLSVEKRIHLLFDSIPDGFILVIVGDGDLRRSLLAKQAQDRRIFVVAEMMSQQQLRVVYKAADVTVSASNFETYGMTVHESLLCGTPVVVQQASGFCSQVRNGVNGYLTYFEDSQRAKQDILRAVSKISNPKPFRPSSCVDLVNFVETVGKSKLQSVSTLQSWLITAFEFAYLIPARICQFLLGAHESIYQQ